MHWRQTAARLKDQQTRPRQARAHEARSRSQAGGQRDRQARERRDTQRGPNRHRRPTPPTEALKRQATRAPAAAR